MPKCALHDVAIVATYNTQQAKRLPEQNELALLQEIITALCEQTQLQSQDIDGLNISSPVWNLKPREAITLLYGPDNHQPKWCGNEFMGIAAVLEAAGAIATGQAETVIIASAQAGEYQHSGGTAPWTRPAHEFVECFGLYTAAEFALCAQRYQHEYGDQRQAMNEVAKTIRNHGHLHPQAANYAPTPAFSTNE